MYHDGPLMRHLHSSDGKDYFIIWKDVDSIFNRWMLFKVDNNLLHRFFQGQIDARQMVLQNPDGFVHFVDIDGDIEWKRTTRIPVHEIPEIYLPEKSVFYEKGYFGDYGNQLQKTVGERIKNSKKKYAQPAPPTALVSEPPPPKYSKSD